MGFQTYSNIDDLYSDLDLDFFENPSSKDVSIKYGTEAIKRSIRNLIFTNYFEKLFRPQIGSDVSAHLFELNDLITPLYLKDAITTVINTYEPRVKLQDVVVVNDVDNNGFNVTITYTILKGGVQTISSLFLERIR